MTDRLRLLIGTIGTLTSWELKDFATGAALAASVMTGIFMALSAIEKYQVLRDKNRDKNKK